jgi:hypothetical protein
MPGGNESLEFWLHSKACRDTVRRDRGENTGGKDSA